MSVVAIFGYIAKFVRSQNGQEFACEGDLANEYYGWNG
jgi:hypothetical protein